MNCRGKSIREQIVIEYAVTPIIHARLLNGQTKPSDATALITDQYYIFECVHRETSNKEIIQCGMGAARHLLELTNHEPLPIFNMLRDGGGAGGVSGPGGGGRIRPQWNPAAKQLYNAIMILIVDWNAKPDTPLFAMKKQAEKYSNYEPFIDRIERVNNIIAKDSKHRTVATILDDLRVAGNDVREYNFDLLTDKLIQNGIDSNF